MGHLPSAGGPTPLSLRSYHPLNPSAAHDGTLLLLVVGERVSKGRGVSSASWVRGPAISRDSASLGPSPIASRRAVRADERFTMESTVPEMVTPRSPGSLVRSLSNRSPTRNDR